MFGTGHPQPPHRREVAMQIVRQQRRDFDAHRLDLDPPGGAVAPPVPAAESLEFEVACTLAEYLGIVRGHLAFTLRRLPRLVRLRRMLVPLALALLSGWSLPAYAYRIDTAGIVRTTPSGTMTRSWAQVDAVRRYRQGYLLLSGEDGMPIPHRCLDARQQALFRRLTLAAGQRTTPA